MNNREAVEQIRAAIVAEAEALGYTLRPTEIGDECCAWVRAKDVLGHHPVPNIVPALRKSRRLIEGYRNTAAAPEKFGFFDKVDERIEFARTKLADYHSLVMLYKKLKREP